MGKIIDVADKKQLYLISTHLRIKLELLKKAYISNAEADAIIFHLNRVDADNADKRFWDYRKAVEDIVYKRINHF